MTNKETKEKSKEAADEQLKNLKRDGDKVDISGLKSKEGKSESEIDAVQRKHEAATTIQASYRGYRLRRENDGFNLSPDSRWGDAINRLRFQTTATDGNNGDATQKWRRADFLVSRLQDNHPESTPEDGTAEASDSSMDPEDIPDDDPNAEGKQAMAKVVKEEKTKKPADSLLKKHGGLTKTMETQHWLEMTDSKHRYGSNLKYYHAYWNENCENDNFFHWLDHGEGANLSLPECSREQLDKEQITYLSLEQRLNYLAVIKDGLVVWAHSGEPIDTTTKFKDSGNGTGIVPNDDEHNQNEQEDYQKDQDSSSDSSSDSASDDDESSADSAEIKAQGKHYVEPHKGPLYYAKPAAVTDRLLRKTVSKNTWIYVADLHFNLYIGIKDSGTFQHSSFLSGSRVTSAGLIKISKGKLKSISPLSGHYRCTTKHFRQWLHVLEEQGVNLEDVNVSKSYILLFGMERLGKLKMLKKSAQKKVKNAKKKVKKALPGDDNGVTKQQQKVREQDQEQSEKPADGPVEPEAETTKT